MARVKKEVEKKVRIKENLDVKELGITAGKLKEKIDKLTKEFNGVKKQLDELIVVGEVITAGKYKISKIKKIRTALDTDAIGKKLTKKDLLDVVTISKTKLRKIMPEKEISKYEKEATISTELRITKGD